MRNQNPTVLWILNDQNSFKWSLEGCYLKTKVSASCYSCTTPLTLLCGPYAAILAIEIPYYSQMLIDKKKSVGHLLHYTGPKEKCNFIQIYPLFSFLMYSPGTISLAIFTHSDATACEARMRESN